MINERLKAVRKSSGLSQQNVADYLGLDRTTYTYYEMGTTCPSVATFTKLAQLYKTTVAYLICETDSPKRECDDAQPRVAEEHDFLKTITKEEKVLISLYRALDEEDKKALLKKLNPNKKRYEAKNW